MWQIRYHKRIASCIWRRNHTYSALYLKKRLDAYFPKYKLGIEIDEYNYDGRNFESEQSRQFMIESNGITIIRTNPDAADFDMSNKPNI